MKEKITSIISKHLEINISDFKFDISQANCDNWDSLKTLFIVSDLEEEFNIQFEPSEMESMNSYDAIIKVIKTYINE